MADNLERPAIIIGVPRTVSHTARLLEPLLNGIEEEQIPILLKTITVDDVVSRAYQAALASRLSVGIAYDGDRYVVHYKNLPEQHPLFDIRLEDNAQQRVLGANAARLVKGIPFKKLA